jgi:signal transduction histidine kinase
VTDRPASFRFAPDILRRLGEELNPSFDQSILELVKNSYDADATNCKITLQSTDHPGGIVQISDDGDGMDVDGIVNGWLVLGRSGRNPEQRTRLNRIPAGSKGLGRLAALRLGSIANVNSRPHGQNDREYKLRIQWSHYETAGVVEEVPLIVEECERPPGASKGTDITVEDLHHTVSRIDIRDLARSLILLADPFADNPEGFKPVLKAPEFSDLEKLVESRYFNEAELHLSATLDNKGRAQAVVTDWKGYSLYSAKHDELRLGKNNPVYKCPTAQFDLWVFILSAETFSTRTSTIKDVREWLGSFGGVHVYQNGLRVSSYGDPANDWLEMNLSRARSPEERPSTNTSIGRVTISDTADQLRQKTDRSGFIENDAFRELKRFATDALEWMARRRMQRAQKTRAKERSESAKHSEKARVQVRKAIQRSPAKARPALKQAFKKYETIREKEVKTLRREVQLYRTLSTAGITAATFAHESAGNPIKVIDQAAKSVERRAKKELGSKYQDSLAVPVELILRSTDALKVLGNVTLSLLDHEKRRSGRVDIHQVIKSVIHTYRPFLEEQSVKLEARFATGDPYLRGSQAAVESIITNFLNNSLVWLHEIHGDERKILIVTESSNGTLTVQFHDNGPGIEGIPLQDIWVAGETTRPNGTGLGLAIVHDTVRDLGGDVRAIAHGDLGGATFLVTLPFLGI